MDNAILCRSFRFTRFRFEEYHVTDARIGVATNYIGFMRRGTSKFVSQDESVGAEVGDIIFIPNGCRYVSHWYPCPDTLFSSFAFTAFPELNHISYPLQSITPDEEMKRLIELIDSEGKVSCASVGALFSLLSLLLPKLKKSAPDPKLPLVQKAVQYMYSHDGYKNSDLAKLCAVSESALYSAFRRVTGKTPVEYKNEILSERALSLLSTTDTPIGEISSSLGFCSTEYFRKIIRKHLGASPTEIRRRSGSI